MVDKTDLESVQWLLEAAHAIKSGSYTIGEKVLLLRLLVARTREYFDGLTTENLSIAATQHQSSLKQREEERQAEERERQMANLQFGDFLSFDDFYIPPMAPLKEKEG